MLFVVDFLRGEEAATAVEYAVMLALILGALIGAVGAFGQSTGSMWGGIHGELQTVGFAK